MSKTDYFGSSVSSTIDTPACMSIRNLGPVAECNLEFDDFMFLAGQETSGKSTIAKCVYFFRTIKEDLCSSILRYKNIPTYSKGAPSGEKLFKLIKSFISTKFIQTFGVTLISNSQMRTEYQYGTNTWIKVALADVDSSTYVTAENVKLEFSQDIFEFIYHFDSLPNTSTGLQAQLNKLFHDDYTTFYIPSSRGLTSVLTYQIDYLFATMDDEQKSTVDYCTRKYIEQVIKLRPLFSKGISGLITEDSEATQEAKKLVLSILHGEYVFTNYVERIYLCDDERGNRYVPLSYASSGQQESVWILNILFYLFTTRTKAFVIIEEPEAHLCPDAQMQITDFMLSVIKCNCKLLITSNSDHVLNRLTHRAVGSHVQNWVRIYTLSSSDGHSRLYDKIRIDQVNGLVGCPEGFFTQYGSELWDILEKGVQNLKSTLV